MFAYCGGSPAHRLTDGSAPTLPFLLREESPLVQLFASEVILPLKEREPKAHLHLPHIQFQPQEGPYRKSGGMPPFWERLVSPSVLHTTSFPPRLSCGINSKFLECSWHLYESPIAAVTNDSKINNREILIYYLHLLPNTYYPTSSGNQKFGGTGLSLCSGPHKPEMSAGLGSLLEALQDRRPHFLAGCQPRSVVCS